VCALRPLLSVLPFRRVDVYPTVAILILDNRYSPSYLGTELIMQEIIRYSRGRVRQSGMEDIQIYKVWVEMELIEEGREVTGATVDDEYRTGFPK